MSDLRMFMVANNSDDLVDYVASERMGEPVLDKNGKSTGEVKPAVWKLKSVGAKLDEKIRKECMVRVAVNSKRGQYREEIDNDKYIGKLCVASTVEPNLNSAELQDFYGVQGADDLLKTMLNAGEYALYKVKVMEVNGFDMSMEDEVEEAKN